MITLDEIQPHIQRSVAFALEEDMGDGDITAQLIPQDHQSTATVITRENCVVCGIPWFDEVFQQLGKVATHWQVNEGDWVKPNTTLVTLSGDTRTLLSGERTALNFLQTLCGTATTSRAYAQAVTDTKITVLDTRKTIPGLRRAQKYAVGIGGCHNHRIGLYDAFLIKENHIAAVGSITQAIAKARIIAPDKCVEVEVETLEELHEALAAQADVVMLDNFSDTQLEQAFALNKPTSRLEISGNIELDQSGLNYKGLRYKDIEHSVSSGALTKHCRAVDLSFRVLY